MEALGSRPHSVSFLGKETDTATPLRLENFGRINFSLGRWITRGKKTPKSMTPYAKVPGELVRIFFHSLLWPQRSLLYGFPPHCTKQSVFLTLQLDRICQNRVSYLSAMLFYRFYAALAGLLHGNHCYFDRCSPFFSYPIIKYTKDDTGVSYLSAMRLLPAILLHLKWQVEKVNAAHPD